MSADLADLNPLFQPIARAILAETQERLGGDAPGASRVRAAVTFRNLIDQAAAKASGRSRVSLGLHQFGFALDVAIIDPNGEYVTNGEDPRYALFGEVAKSHGCIWGGDWSDPDWDHCNMDLGMSATEYAAWIDAHRVVTA
jgi:D-alanyl-D-alanine carboxypeptidase